MQTQPPPLNQPQPDLSLIDRSVEIESINIPSDSLARQENQRLLNDGKRGEEYRKHIHLIVVVGMYTIGFIMVVLTLIRAYHFAAPIYWRWLSEEDSHGIERIIFSGIILSFATKYFKKFKVVEE